MTATAFPSISQVRQATSPATALLRVLANEDRFLLLSQLIQEEKCVSELEQLLDIQQPTLSQQLGVLRSEGLVATRREGKQIYYRVSRPDVLPLLTTIYGLYCKRARGRPAAR